MARGAELERRIRIAMAAAHVRSIRALARDAHILPATLYAWFAGRNPPKAETLRKVADALDVRIGELWDYEATNMPPPLVSPEALDEIRAAVAEGVALGVARALAQLAGPQPPRPRRPPRQ
jgi:transcriptional regulator with XRE-family HTH domain